MLLFWPRLSLSFLLCPALCLSPPELPPVYSPLCSFPSPLSPVFALFFILIFFILSVSASALCP